VAKRDGSTSEKVAVRKEAPPPKQLWKATVGNGYASPVVASVAILTRRAIGKDSRPSSLCHRPALYASLQFSD